MRDVIFIFSLPRSGSTLLQRILSVHPEIETFSEPWALLPLVYAVRRSGVYAEYSAKSVGNALRDVVACLPNGLSDYYQAVRKFAQSIYSGLCRTDGRYFLDKTPRYYLIIQEIKEIFPDGKFIFLFRQPLAAYASMIETFNQGRLGNVRHRIDAFEGPALLAQGWEMLSGKAHRVQFEDLVLYPEQTLRSICGFLAIKYRDDLIERFVATSLGGSMGDSVGSNTYREIEIAPLEKWKKTFSTGYRRRHAKQYLHYLGRDTIDMLGYDSDLLFREVEQLKILETGSVGDFCDLWKGKVYCFLDVMMMKDKMKNRIRSKKRLRKYYYTHF